MIVVTILKCPPNFSLLGCLVTEICNIVRLIAKFLLYLLRNRAPAALWDSDIRLIPIFIPFPENGSHFGCSWNFGRNQSHSKAKIKYSKNVLLTFSNFGSEVPEKGVPSQTKFRFFNKIANNSKVAAPRNL